MILKDYVVKEYSNGADADTKTVIFSFNDIRICSAAAKDAISFHRRQTFTLVPGVLSLADFAQRDAISRKFDPVSLPRYTRGMQ